MSYRRERIAVARHEAGHVFMRVYLHRPVVYAEITRRAHSGVEGVAAGGKRIGHVDGFRSQRARVEDAIMISLAGPEAERRFWCEIGLEENFNPYAMVGPEPFDRGDYGDALEAAVLMCNGFSEEATACLRWLHLRVQGILDLPEAAASIEAVADALLEQGRVTGATLRGLVHAADEATRPDPAALRRKWEATLEAHRRGEHLFDWERLGDMKTVFAYLPHDLFPHADQGGHHAPD